MKKILFLIPTFFYLFLFSSCDFILENKKEDLLTITLPQWPPEGPLKENYPTLSRWRINVRTAFNNYTFYCTNNSFNVNTAKNQPMAITAQPITRNSEGQETVFFKPAGLIYPYENSNLTWENGFIADLMAELFNSKPLSENQSKIENQSDTNYFISTFNWNKATTTLNDKLANEENFNPWLLNKSNILSKLSTKRFSSTYLKLSYVYKYNIQKSNTENEKIHILSSFIPENSRKYLTEENQIVVKKDTPDIFYTSPDRGFIINYNSSKKVSLQYINLPILVEGYETN